MLYIIFHTHNEILISKKIFFGYILELIVIVVYIYITDDE